MNKNETIAYLKNISLVLIAGTLLVFPLFFLTNTTDFYVFPKQVLFTYVTIALLVLWGIRMVIERRLTLRTTPFNVPIFLFGAIVLISSLIAPDMYDSLFQSVPVVMLLIFYFVTVNTIDNRSSFNIALSALSIGAVLSSLLSVLYYFKLYVLPIPAIQTQYFTTFGSPVQHIAYLLPILLLSSLYVWRRYRAGHMKEFTTDYSLMIHVVSAVIILLGIAVTIFKVAVLPQKPIVLPFQYGFQIALAAVGQDAARMLLSFLFGSGYGTFLTDFTRFHSPNFNLDQSLWTLSFSFSSSYILELIATTGVLGLISYLFILFKVIKTRLNPFSPLYAAVIAAFVLSLVVPFSFSLVMILFVLLSFYATYLFLEGDKRVFDVVISLVALRQGLLSFANEEEANHHRRQSESMALPIAILVVFILVGGFVAIFTTKLLSSDMLFAESLQQQSLQNGQKTYDLQRTALDQTGNFMQSFPYKSDYYRIFSQVNLALANSLIASTPKGATPSAQVQQTVIALLQQSINSARASVTLSPMTASNWENLSSIYRSLIGVGQNADQFAIASMNQAISLDPLNPQLRITLGGIYYQLGAYDQAENQFQIATNMKPDFANAWYNLGHAYEAKGDTSKDLASYQNAYNAYQTVQQLVANDPNSLKQINSEMDALKKKAQNLQEGQTKSNVQPTEGQQPPLQVNQPQEQLPSTGQPVKISPPPVTPTPSKESETQGNQNNTTEPSVSPTK